MACSAAIQSTTTSMKLSQSWLQASSRALMPNLCSLLILDHSTRAFEKPYAVQFTPPSTLCSESWPVDIEHPCLRALYSPLPPSIRGNGWDCRHTGPSMGLGLRFQQQRQPRHTLQQPCHHIPMYLDMFVSQYRQAIQTSLALPSIQDTMADVRNTLPGSPCRCSSRAMALRIAIRTRVRSHGSSRMDNTPRILRGHGRTHDQASGL